MRISRTVMVGLLQHRSQSSNSCAGGGFCVFLAGDGSGGGDGAGCSWISRSKRFAILLPPIVFRSIWERCLRRGVADLAIMSVGAGLNGLIDVDHVGTQVDRDLESVFCRRGLWAHRGHRS